jgi:hypothetical protein
MDPTFADASRQRQPCATEQRAVEAVLLLYVGAPAPSTKQPPERA